MAGEKKTQHTPGPWEAIGWDVRTKRTDTDRRGFVIATTEISPFADERHADARLIAAAPDLLEALKTTLGNLRDLKANAFRNLDTIDEWIAVVEAAFARAEGKS